MAAVYMQRPVVSLLTNEAGNVITSLVIFVHKTSVKFGLDNIGYSRLIIVYML